MKRLISVDVKSKTDNTCIKSLSVDLRKDNNISLIFGENGSGKSLLLGLLHRIHSPKNYLYPYYHGKEYSDFICNLVYLDTETNKISKYKYDEDKENILTLCPYLDSTQYVDDFAKYNGHAVSLKKYLNHWKLTDFYTKEILDVFFKYYPKIPKKFQYIHYLSNGQYYFLHIINMAYTCSVVKDYIFLIKNPETHLSLPVKRDFVSILEQLAPNSQFIMSTNSSTLVDHPDDLCELKTIYNQ